jgi:hypothetical protein
LTYIENQNYNYRGTVEAGNGSYSTVAATNTWEKVTYAPTSILSVTQGAGGILERKISSNGDMFYDDFCLYESSTGFDNTVPDQPTLAVVGTPTTSSLNVSWTAPASTDGGGFIVVRGLTDPTTVPNVNGIYKATNIIAVGMTVVYQGTATSFTDNSLDAGTTYYYRIYTYDKAYNYSSALTGNGTTNSSSSSSSDITGAANETSNIAYATYQAASITAIADAVRMFSFTIRDGGGVADGDALPTILASITLNKGGSNGVTSWANTIRQAALYDGTTEVAEVSVTGETISFTGLSGANVTAADNGTKTLDLYVTFESSVTDNQQFQFQITNANVTAAASGSSTFSAFTAVTSSVTSDANRIEVTASGIIFDQNVSTVALGAVMSPSPTVRAIDANLNYDLDYAASWSVAVTTGLVTFDGTATTSGSFSSGVSTLSNLKFNVAGNGNKITVTSGSFTDESGLFDVTNPLPEINLKQNVTSIASGGSYDFSTQLSGTSSSPITFTIENLGSADLNLTGTPKVAKSGTNAAEFTIDETSTSAAVSASGTTTYTVTFSPTSQGAKSAQLSIANDDATGSENPYIINLTGTGTVSSASDIANTSGYSFTSNVGYASYQTVSSLATGNSVGVNGLTIRDGAGVADADNLGTTLTGISFTTGGSTAIRTAALFDGSTNVSEVTVNGATTITFSGLSLTTADAGSKDFELRVTYQATVTDNQQITYTVSAVTSNAAGSGFAAADGGAAASTSTGDINRLEVTSSLLAFVVQPTNVGTSSNISPAVTVSANDANGNRDLDYVTDISITASGATLTGSPVSGTPVSGLGTFSALSFSTAGTGVTLSASSGVITQAISNSFNVTSTPKVFISEYLEGSSNNKAFEIYNGENTSIDLALLTIKMYANGGVTPNSTLNALSGTLQAGSVYVIAHSSSNATILALANSLNASVNTFNGDDVIEVIYNSVTTDIFGVIGTDPGASWTVAGNTSATVDKSVLRKLSVTQGNTVWASSAGTNATDSEWVVYSTTDYSNNLGFFGTAWLGTTNTTWSTATNWDVSTPSSGNNVVIPDVTNDPILSGSATIAKLTIRSAGVLNIANTGQLTVSGALTNSATATGLVVESGGSLMQSSNSVLATVNRSIDAWGGATAGWHLLSAPVSDQTFTSFTSGTTGGYDFYLWRETFNEWVNHKAESGTFGSNFVAGKGYLASYENTSTKQFIGTLNNGNVSASLTYSSTMGRKGWNLIGNPYSCGLIWDNGSWATANADINGTAKIILSADGSFDDISQGEIIPAMNGFFVHTVAAASLTIPAASKTHGGSWYKEAESVSKLTLTVTDLDGQTAQRSHILVRSDATFEFDNRFDGEFMPLYAPSFYSIVGEHSLSTNAIPNVNNETVIEMGFVKNEGNSFRLTASGLESIQADIYLTDRKTGNTQNLRIDPVYNFTGEENDSPNRFKITFGAVGINESENQNSLHAYVYGNRVYVTNALGTASMQLFDLQGRLVQASQLNGEGLQSQPLNLPAGVYIVRVQNEKSVKSVKIVISE